MLLQFNINAMTIYTFICCSEICFYPEDYKDQNNNTTNWWQFSILWAEVTAGLVVCLCHYVCATCDRLWVTLNTALPSYLAVTSMRAIIDPCQSLLASHLYRPWFLSKPHLFSLVKGTNACPQKKIVITIFQKIFYKNILYPFLFSCFYYFHIICLELTLHYWTSTLSHKINF